MLALIAAAAVAVTGTAQQGQKLTAAVPAGATVQWYRCAPDASHCSSIHGARGPGYTLGSKDVGKALTVNSKLSDGTTSYASAVGPVAATSAKLAATVQPKLSGDGLVGRPLAVDNGTWTTTPAGYTYAWLRCNANGRICLAIAGAAQATYTPVANDVGHALVARVTASTGTSAQPTLSFASPAIVAATGPIAAVAPSVTGTAKQGERLVAVPGTWTGSGTVTFDYQWYRCDPQVAHCTSIHGATAAGYRLGARDAGKTLTLTLKATDSVASVSVFLSAVGPIAPATAAVAATLQPRVTGTTTLTVDGGAWTATPPALTHTWLRCNANGRVCVPISGATAQSYAPTADDTGHSLVATVNGVLSTRTP